MEFRVQRCAYAESAFFYSPRQLLEWPRLTDLLYETGKEKVDSWVFAFTPSGILRKICHCVCHLNIYTIFVALIVRSLAVFFVSWTPTPSKVYRMTAKKSRAKPSNQRHSVSVSWNVLNLGFICQAYLWTWSVWQKVRESERCRAKITNSRNILLSDNNASLVCIVRFAVDLSLLCRVLFFWLECRLNKRAKSCKQTKASKQSEHQNGFVFFTLL